MFKELFKFPFYIAEGLSYHLGGILFTPKPRMVQFPVCDRCNAKCIMCHRWQKEKETEISTEKIREVFTNGLFSKVEEVCLHGGEPTLRKDLSDICKIIQDACPKIKRLWISTNGFGPKRIEQRTHEILNVLNLKKIDALEINVSIDGLEETHDKIRGIKGGFRQSIETIQILKRLSNDYPLTVSIGTVIQPLNLYQIDEIEKLAKNMEVAIGFQPLMFDKFFNISGNTKLKFSEKDREEFKKLITKNPEDYEWHIMYNCRTKGLLYYLENFFILYESWYLIDELCLNGHCDKFYKPTEETKEIIKEIIEDGE